MRHFIAKKRIKVPRYKLYYLLFIFSVLLIVGFNFLLNFFLKTTNQEEFLNVFVGNAFGNVTEYHFSNSSDSYLYQSSFGIPFYYDKPVMGGNDSLDDIVTDDEKEIVYLYNTFQTDKYKSDYFSSYSIGSFVTQASFILSEYLGEHEIGSVVETKSVAKTLKEKYIPYANSYAASRILLESAVEDVPSLTYYFDLQISDYEREATTALIDGVSYAKILFVVGTDNSKYVENQSLAVRFNEILESISPTLSRGVSLRGGAGYQGVYNQDFSPNAILIQVGGVHNTIDEVNRSLKVLAEVIATYIKEDYEER